MGDRSKGSIGSACIRKRRRRGHCPDEARRSKSGRRISSKGGTKCPHGADDRETSRRSNEPKAMLLAERACNERLVQIIEEMQRHRFGYAETLPEDQMLRSKKSSRLKPPRPRK